MISNFHNYMFASIFAQLNRQSQHTRLLQHITKKKIFIISASEIRKISGYCSFYILSLRITHPNMSIVSQQKKEQITKGRRTINSSFNYCEEEKRRNCFCTAQLPAYLSTKQQQIRIIYTFMRLLRL